MGKPNLERLERIWQIIEREPGITALQIAAILGTYELAVMSALCTMNNNGYLLSEDQYGGLYTFAKTTEVR